MRLMHVGILASPDRGAEVKAVMRTLRQHAIDTRGVSVSSTWTAYSSERLDEVLGRSTHLLLFPDGTDTPDWVMYALGYAVGRSLPSAVVGAHEIPPALEKAERVDIEDLENYVLAERSGWERRHRTELALRRLGGREADPDAFYRAALAADRQTVDDFLAAGRPADIRSSEGVPLLVGAVRGRCIEIVQHLLGHGADPNATCGSDGATPLCEAASLGTETILGVLLVHGADPNRVTANGQTALMLAASQGHADIVARLLSAGADTSHRDSLGMTAVEYARLFGWQEVVELLEGVNRS
jgi:uncharacterized protein